MNLNFNFNMHSAGLHSNKDSYIYGISEADALTKAMDISMKDAEEYPMIKNEIFCPVKITALARFLTKIDPDYAFEKFSALETNKKRLRSELKFIVKMHWTKNSSLIDKHRLIGLLPKYKLALREVGPVYKINIFPIPLLFPDIFSAAIKQLNLDLRSEQVLKNFKNFKKEHHTAALLAFLPKGQKYGGFAKVLFTLTLNLAINILVFMEKEKIIQDVLSEFRALYHSTFVPQQRRLEYFEGLQIQQSDCENWSKIFDAKYPELSYINELFGQIA